MKYKWPYLTVILSLASCALLLLPSQFQAALYFNYELILQGEYWRLISGHWVHADTNHLLWNIAGLVILGAIIERRSRSLLLSSLLLGSLCVDLLLLSPFSSIQVYIGLSGVLNTLMAAVLPIYWRETRSPIVIVTGLLCLAKIVLEMQSGQSLFSDISWPPYALAHLAGFSGAVVLLFYFGTNKKSPDSWPAKRIGAY